jgi:NADH-quinone oxidoreductase subunit F
LETYRGFGGYTGVLRALQLTPDQLIGVVQTSGLRDRDGARFLTSDKWSAALDSGTGVKYLVIDCAESEPNACKDVPLLLASPHLVIEGAIIAAYAIGAHQVFICIRGEALHAVRRVQQGVAEAYRAGYLGERALGVNYRIDITVHAGAGSYIRGEETALLNSLLGRAGRPSSQPPYPVSSGLYGEPTVVSNCETIAALPAIVSQGGEWYAQFGTANSRGTTVYSVSGHVQFPGQFEAPCGTTVRALLEFAGGIREGHKLKFFTAGGLSTPLFTEEQLDMPLPYGSATTAKAVPGGNALQFFDETTSVLRVTRRWMECYAAESCGKCSPCREGSWWLSQLLSGLAEGRGQEGDVERILDICDGISGRAFCPLADGFVGCVTGAIRQFRSEFEVGYRRAANELFPEEQSAVFAWNESVPTAKSGNGGFR